jgi:hypothetical protein
MAISLENVWPITEKLVRHWPEGSVLCSRVVNHTALGTLRKPQRRRAPNAPVSLNPATDSTMMSRLRRQENAY